jgi:hypothetical protein
MIGMQNIRNIKRFRRLSRRLCPIEQVEKMCRLVEVGPHRRKREALSGAVEIGGNYTDLGGDANGAATVGIFAPLFPAEAAVIKTKHRHCRTHDIHGIGTDRSGRNEILDPPRKFAFATQLSLKLVKLRAIRQRAMPEQVNDLLIGGLAGKFVDVIAGVDENSFFSKHIAQAG